ncbi:hypothetical protein, partial [Klebsiella pneumoniae]|uniref:hypothetical protein n=1 Tax=Klebsiella pneumoniae TaxID=573 RepID=UPI001C4F2635
SLNINNLQRKNALVKSPKSYNKVINRNRENLHTACCMWVRGVGLPGEGGFAVDFTVSSFLFSYFLSTL